MTTPRSTIDYGRLASGVYAVAAPVAPRPNPALTDVDLVRVSLRGARDREEILAQFAAALDFPDWFGANWDALEDCLCDLSWRPAVDHVLVVTDADEMLRFAGSHARILLDILQATAASWNDGPRMIVLWVDAPPSFHLPEAGAADA